MPDLSFQIESASVVPFAAVPIIAFQLRSKTQWPMRRSNHCAPCQIQIGGDAAALRPEGGEAARSLWSPRAWKPDAAQFAVDPRQPRGPRVRRDEIRLWIYSACTFDFNVGATKYFAGLTDGDIPLQILSANRLLCAILVSGSRVCTHLLGTRGRFKLPVKLWREMMGTLLRTVRGSACAKMFFERIYQTRRSMEFHLGARLERVLDLALAMKRWCARESAKGGKDCRGGALRGNTCCIPIGLSSVKEISTLNFGVLYPAAYCEGKPDLTQAPCRPSACPRLRLHATDRKGAVPADCSRTIGKLCKPGTKKLRARSLIS